jgi:hypothetical protein
MIDQLPFFTLLDPFSTEMPSPEFYLKMKKLSDNEFVSQTEMRIESYGVSG